MTDWQRDTPWRQGSLVRADTARTLIEGGSSASAIAIVISHDCDLAQQPDKEPKVEIIVGEAIPKPDGNLSHAKNPRQLHVTASAGPKRVCIDLRAINKLYVRKTDLAGHTPDADVLVSAEELNILQRWLSARYRRAAFPDEFERRLYELGLNAKLGRILKKTGESLSAIFFDVDSGEEHLRAGADDPYMLRIILVYDSEGENSAEVASAAKAEIEALFNATCFKSGAWSDIEFLGCSVTSDQGISYRQSQYFKRWSTVDHLSLREGAQSPIEA